MFGIHLKLPNRKFRKDVIHIHDIHHILNNCNTSWKGEAFISAWEISTGFYKYFPICIFSLWTMGYSIWIHPQDVLKGFKKGLNNVGVIEWMHFLFWSLISQIIFLFPLILIFFAIIFLKK